MTLLSGGRTLRNRSPFPVLPHAACVFSLRAVPVNGRTELTIPWRSDCYNQVNKRAGHAARRSSKQAYESLFSSTCKCGNAPSQSRGRCAPPARQRGQAAVHSTGKLPEFAQGAV